MRRLGSVRSAIFASALSLVSLAGCATSRGVVAPPTFESANPETGVAVKLVRVTDARKFELAPPDPSTPSLKDAEIGNSAITTRAIARKRNTYGKALGDILLEEGDSVPQLVTDVIEKALREAGYRVLEAGEAGFEAAAPLEADIEKLWMWFSPGFWAIHMEFDGLIRVKGAIAPFEDGEEFKGYVRVGAQAATENQWMKTLQQGLDDLRKNIVTGLRGPAARDASAPIQAL